MILCVIKSTTKNSKKAATIMSFKLMKNQTDKDPPPPQQGKGVQKMQTHLSRFTLKLT